MKSERENLIELSVNNLLMLNATYRKGTPKVSDEEFDTLEAQLKELDPQNPYFNKGINDESGMVPLPTKMTSLDKIKSLEEIKKWLLKHNLPLSTNLICLPKLDGCAILKDGLGVSTYTRGDGEKGGKIDLHFSHVPFKNNYLWDNGYIIGEALISKKVFKEKYSKEVLGEKEGYANPRNMVAALFNPYSIPQKEKLKDVTFIPHSLATYQSDASCIGKQFQVNICNQISSYPLSYNVTSIEEGLNEGQLNAMFKSWSEDFEIDGIVIEIVDADIRKSLGYEKNGNPVFAKAYKKNWEEIKETTIHDIKFQIGKTGKITPVGVFNPIILEGAECTNVTLYNLSDMMKKNITIGSKIRVCRSGGVIAKVVEVLNPEKPGLQYELLQKAGIEWSWDDNKVEGYVKGHNDEQEIQKLVYFFKTYGVEDFGEPTIRKIYENGYRTIKEILNISMLELINIEGIGLITAETLIKYEFKKVHEISFAKLADASCCFEGLAEKTLELIELNFLSRYEEVIDDLKELEEIEGVGPISAKSFIKGHMDFKIWLIENNLNYPSIRKKQQLGNRFENQIICFTGFRDNELKSKIELEGGKVTDSVSGNTTLLIVKEITTKTSSKEQKAKDLGIQIQSVEDFKTQINNTL